MRSLGTIRSRVERLASVCLSSPAPMTIFHEQFHYERCPACRAELGAHARAVAAGRAYRDVRGVTHVFGNDYDTVMTCPRCDAPLP